MDRSELKNKKMNFNQIVLEKLEPLFLKYDLNIVEQRDDYLKFESSYLSIAVTHNKLEKSNTIWLSRNKKTTNIVEMDDTILRDFFGSALKISQVPMNTFVDNLASFFENEGKLLLIGDAEKMKELEQFSLKRSRAYTDELLARQHLSAADKAWKNEDYLEFVNLINQVNERYMLPSYKSKYAIAKKRVDR